MAHLSPYQVISLKKKSPYQIIIQNLLGFFFKKI